MIFDTIKEGITEVVDEHLGTFCYNIVAMVGAHSLIFESFGYVGLLSSSGIRTLL